MQTSRIENCVIFSHPRPGLLQARLLACVVLSILLHASILLALRQQRTVQGNVAESKPQLSVRLTPRVQAQDRVAAGHANREAQRTKEAPARRNRVPRSDAPSHEPAPTESPPAAIPEDVPRSESRESDSGRPYIDPEASFKMARETDRAARGRRSQEWPGVAAPAQERETVLGRGIARSARFDCRTAHADKGLLAIAFLIRDGLAGEGCEW